MELNLPSVVAEVQAAFDAYESDLVANRIDALVDWFWNDEWAVRHGIDECLYGFDEIAEYRRGQAMATPPRTLRNLVITAFGHDVATANVEFLPIGSDGIVGRQSQVWIRTPGGWRIASAHVSWLSGRGPGA